MNKKAKSTKIFIIITVVSLAAVLFIGSINIFPLHYRYHYWPYHFKGSIEILLDGEVLDIDGLDFTLFLHEKAFETCEIQNGKFRLAKNDYGPKKLQLVLPHGEYPILPNSDVVFEFSVWSVNWPVFKYDIQITIDTTVDGADVSVYATGSETLENFGKRSHKIDETAKISDLNNEVECSLVNGP